ncbi:hypothetical protein V8E52_011360 [Russula decolorans]
MYFLFFLGAVVYSHISLLAVLLQICHRQAQPLSRPFHLFLQYVCSKRGPLVLRMLHPRPLGCSDKLHDPVVTPCGNLGFEACTNQSARWQLQYSTYKATWSMCSVPLRTYHM